jgi:hypothetical protein
MHVDVKIYDLAHAMTSIFNGICIYNGIVSLLNGMIPFVEGFWKGC